MNLEELCLPIKSELSEVDRTIQANLVSSSPFVTDIAQYVAQNGGKRLRPILCLLSSRISGARDKRIIESAVAMEFFHTATLMHDDVIDNAELRRGKTSANSRWGNQIAVLVGDFFYCRASDLLVGLRDLRVIELITRIMQITTEGEIFEIVKSNDLNCTEDDYLKIVRGKTAELMGACCEIGGILGNVSEEFTQALREYGLHIGIAFQLADDLLDYMSDPSQFGKTKGTDLKEGKLTLPLLVALKKANEPERRLIKDALIAERLEENRLKEIISIIEYHGGIQATRDLAQSYIQKAKEALTPFKPSIEKEALVCLADYVIQRQQ
ncbi:MAG: polyprenyl synthetase family protein [Deltaproteobacteria bacterium]|nr:polyprenyl synthetase family protein [Deltaproteobacteria bacterium]